MDRQSPFDSVESWLEQMGEQFGTAAWGTGLEPWAQGTDRPRIDMTEDEDSYTITADVPGFTADDVEVSVIDRTLAIEAERSEGRVTNDAYYLRQERSHQSLSRHITLPVDADTENISASMGEGVLTITIDRTEALDSGHQIDIE
ncbi:Hsp20/alpha crystallin family protein [Haloarcula laminariae]|uniref:Hsp20/alpha crystallin family protein n=1 Tax=Haloarcula laminariae TaxID=2961577 RepID=UPI00240693AD|nr:Hsp20/alpha crystallin family protein [Halomicroarcula sp. FL173]